MYPTLQDSNHKLLLIDRVAPQYHPATYVPPEYLHLIIPYAGLYFEQDSDFEMLSQHITLGPFSLWLHDIYASNDIVLCPYTPFHLWALHFMYEDTLRTDGFTPNAFTLEEKECNLFNLYAEMYRVPMPAGKKILSFHINIPPTLLSELSIRYPSLSILTNKRLQKISGVINEQPYRINAVCNFLIKNILSCKYVETSAWVFLHRCCLDLFLNFAQQDAAAPDPLLLITQMNAALFHQIFAYLVENAHISHSVSTLADMFDLPPVRLAQGFRQHFSIGITPFIQMIRMMFVYHQLMQQSASLSVIASASGFRTAAEMIHEVQGYYESSIIGLRRSI